MNQYRNNYNPTPENPFGSITQIVDKPKPIDYAHYCKWDDEGYNKELAAYESSQSIHIPLTFKTDKEVLVEGVDFELKNCDCVIGEDCKNKKGKWFTPCKVAVEIERKPCCESVCDGTCEKHGTTLITVTENSQGMAYDELWKFFNREHNLTLLHGEMDDIISAVDKFKTTYNAK